MVERSVEFAGAAIGGRLLAGRSDRVWKGAAIDSRRVAGGEIFFALPGEHTDGHRFVADAAARGAAAVVIQQDLEMPAAADDGTESTAWLRVDDTFAALHALTRAVREEVPRSLVAITGSAGKTTTKEFLAAMLATRFRIAKSPGNLNNLYGFPLSLLDASDDCEWMVAEMGMSTPGELREISLLGRPDVVVVTNVRPAHLENFADLRGVAEAKAEIFAGLAAAGMVVANADDPEVMYIVERHATAAGRVVRFGFGSSADVRGSGLAPRNSGGEDCGTGCRFEITADSESSGVETQSIELGIHGLYNAENCLAAAACAHALGVTLADIAAAAATVEPSSHRGAVHRLPGGITLIDDAYNSNPDAAVKALESAREMPAQRRVAILGDMLELGAGAAGFHRRVGERAAELGFAVVGVGELARKLVAAAGLAGELIAERPGGEWLADAEEAGAWARSALASGALRRGDLVLVKGSRGVGLESVVDTLREAAEGKAG
ncbi:MAG: UDP-N-acetylmuramoyl-tripeptide--D-alanyl-D-alanine ligase [Thermoanaerobaculia bacterium]